MPISYNKLFLLMEQKGIKKIDLRSKYGINPKTVDSLVKNKSVTVDTLVTLCKILNCQPGDLIEYIPDKENEPFTTVQPVQREQSISAMLDDFVESQTKIMNDLLPTSEESNPDNDDSSDMPLDL